MSSGNAWERAFALEASVKKMVHDGRRRLDEYVDALQAIVDKPRSKFELYLHPKQKDGGSIKGFNLDRHLRETGLYDRALSLEDEVVGGWLENPSTYPEEFKDKAVFLWKSQQDSGSARCVACLLWCEARVVVYWRWLGNGWTVFCPVLLASSF